MLERYGHGGDLLTATQTYGQPEKGFVDFSSNMNPLGPPPSVRQTLTQCWAELDKYPDPAYRKLKLKLSQAYDITLEALAVGNGAAELIDLAARVIRPGKTGLARPCFSEYEQALSKAGSEIVELLLSEKNNFTIEQDRFEKLLHDTDAVFLGHPNNPTGRQLSAEHIDQIKDKSTESFCILDEAFIDFMPDESAYSQLQQAASHQRLLVIRSMTKFYAIPGLRLGFMVGHPDWIKKIESLQIPWSVNVVAQRVGEAVLDEHDFAKETKEWLGTERPWLVKELQKLGLHVYPSAVNYLLVRLPSPWIASELQQRMGTRGVLIRDASHFPGLTSSYCRVAIKLREQNERLLKEWRTIMEEGPFET